MSTDKIVPIRAGVTTAGADGKLPQKPRKRSSGRVIALRKIDEINGHDIGLLCDELRCLAALVSNSMSVGDGDEEVRLCDVGSLIGGLAVRLQEAKNRIEGAVAGVG